MSKTKILIADDYADNRILLSQITELLDCDASVVDNGRKAIELFDKHFFDIVFMDIEMPVMNGLEATMAIRNNFTRPKNQIPVIAITAHHPEDFETRFHHYGFNGYITKPYTFEKILAVLNTFIK